MSAPTVRRRHHRGPDHRFLPALAGIVDAATAETAGHVVIRVEGPIQPEVDLGLLPLDEGTHPFSELAGLEAPATWTVFGLRVSGRSRRLDEPDEEPRRTSTVFLLDRRGREASLIRHGEEVIDAPGRATGTIPDLCRRVLQLPTDPPPPTTAALWCAVWLDRIIDRWAPLHRRPDLGSFAQLAILHPAVHAPSPPDLLAVTDPASLARVARAHAAATTWEQVRLAREPLPLPDGPLDPSIAAWMDDGFFARWSISAFPPVAATALSLRGVLGERLGRWLLEAMALLLEP
jgi:hypothetical protein